MATEVVAIYYPHWHSYDHGSSWKGEGWTEWEGLKAAVPRFAGHHQPLEPSWGCFDESDPKWSGRGVGEGLPPGRQSPAHEVRPDVGQP